MTPATTLLLTLARITAVPVWGWLLLLVVTAGVFIAFVMRGGLSTRAFASSPPREGQLGLPDLLVALGLLVIGSFLASSLLRLMAPEAAATTQPLNPRQVFWSMGLTQLGSLPVAVFILIRAHQAVRDGLRGFGLYGGDGRTLGVTAAIGFGTLLLAAATGVIVSSFSEYVLHIPSPQVAHEALRAMLEISWGPMRLLLILWAIVAAPFFEELFFRGMMQTALLQSQLVRSRWGVIVLASLLFMAVHSVPWQARPSLFVLAMGLGYLYERTGRLWTSMLIHAAFNALNVAGTLLVIGTSGAAN